MKEVIATQIFNTYSLDKDKSCWYQIEDKQTVSRGYGIRVLYKESGKEISESDYIDIVGSPETIRAIGLAIVNKASELLMRQNVSNFKGE